MDNTCAVLSVSLEAIGWSAPFQEQLEEQRRALADPAIEPARVVIEYQDRYQLLTAAGTAWGQLSGALRRDASSDRMRRPAVGDWVALRPPASEPGGEPGSESAARGESAARDDSVARGDSAARGESMSTIVHLFARKTRFVRQAAGRRAMAQVVAANIDTLFVVTSFREDFNPRRLERYLTTASESGARVVIVLNKADLVADPQPYLTQVLDVAADVPVAVVSAVQPQGLDALRRHVGPGETIALVGSSGVGKSTLVNWLLGRDAQKVGAVSAHDGRGRHTTTHRELLPMPGGGVLIDTPGMRELQLWTEGQGLREAFADIEALAARCRFRDCRHQGEPGCAVIAALGAGQLDHARLQSYVKLRAEQQGQHLRRARGSASPTPRQRGGRVPRSR